MELPASKLLPKAQRNVNDQDAVDFNFSSDWLRWRGASFPADFIRVRLSKTSAILEYF